jgi:hypothetical protein
VSTERISWLVIRKPCDYNTDCAYTNGFPVLAESPVIAILRTCAAIGNISFEGWVGVKIWLDGFLRVVPSVTKLGAYVFVTQWGSQFCQASVPREGEQGGGGRIQAVPWSLNYIVAPIQY